MFKLIRNSYRSISCNSESIAHNIEPVILYERDKYHVLVVEGVLRPGGGYYFELWYKGPFGGEPLFSAKSLQELYNNLSVQSHVGGRYASIVGYDDKPGYIVPYESDLIPGWKRKLNQLEQQLKAANDSEDIKYRNNLIDELFKVRKSYYQNGEYGDDYQLRIMYERVPENIIDDVKDKVLHIFDKYRFTITSKDLTDDNEEHIYLNAHNELNAYIRIFMDHTGKYVFEIELDWEN